MTGDAAMEETLFLVKPELMVAMLLNAERQDGRHGGRPRGGREVLQQNEGVWKRFHV